MDDSLGWVGMETLITSSRGCFFFSRAYPIPILSIKSRISEFPEHLRQAGDLVEVLEVVRNPGEQRSGKPRWMNTETPLNLGF